MFITTWYPHEKNTYQGIFVKEHAKAAALYNNISVLLAYKSDNLKKLYEVNETIEEGIKTYRIKYRTSPLPKTNIILYAILLVIFFNKLLKRGNRFDLIHAHVFYSGLPAAILSMIYGIPFVLSEHYSGIPLGRLSIKEKLLLRFVSKKARRILPVSKSLEKHMKAYGIKNDFDVINNPVDISSFYPNEGRKKRASGVKNILFVGSLEPVKGLPYLLDAAALTLKSRDDFALNIVGDGSMRKAYEDMAAGLGIGHVVKFLGKKNKDEVAQFMRESDFLVSSSEWETFGCVLIEALACGIPVIAPAIGGIPEIIPESSGILVKPKDPMDLSRAIIYMLDHYYEYPSDKISRYAGDGFGYKAIGEKLDGIYRRITEGNGLS